MKATEFVKKEGLWVFKYALAQLSFNKDMFLVVYHYECEFVSEVKDNHGDCVFSYREVKQIVDAFELVETGLPELKKVMFSNSKDLDYVKSWILTVSNLLLTEKGVRLKQAINLVEQCL